MSRWHLIFIASMRKMLVATAMLATLVSVFGINQHESHATESSHATTANCSSDHVCSQALVAGDLSGKPSGELNADLSGELPDVGDCGHCHCHMPGNALPTSVPMVTAVGGIEVIYQQLLVSIPDGPTFQPDPPPIKV